MCSTGITDTEWAEKSADERNKARSNPELYAEKQKEKEEREIQKTEFAKSFNDYYEYDVATVFNKGNGVVDAAILKKVLSEYAAKGWKLHTMYSNELGKNALSVLGFGVNSTACQDVLIFERRIQDDSVR
jgi:hypothetical protein